MTRYLLLLRGAPLLGLGALATGPARAAVALDPNWVLVADLRPAVVYDTNLTARNENLEDTYAAITPKLTLSRRGSVTRFELAAQIERTWFNDHAEFNSTDPQVQVILEYPVRPGDEPTTRLDVRWDRNSAANADLGRRVRSENRRGRWDQRLWDTGHTALELRLDARSTDYREADLNTNEAVAVELRVGYALAARTRIGLGYGHEWTRSLGALERGDTDGEEDRILVRLHGELSPKLSGTLETGVAFVTYDGAVEREDTAWIAAVGLTWEPTAKTTAVLRASRLTDFSPEGETVLRSEVLLDLRQALLGGFALRGGAGLARLETFAIDGEHRANATILIAGLIYQFTERFSAELSERWTRQHADRDTFDYERHVVTALVNFSF